MSRISYTYCVLRYVHDYAANEFLNFGVVVYAPAIRFLEFKIEHTYQRLSNAFEGFDGDQHRKVIRQLEAAIERLRNSWAAPLEQLIALPEDAGSVMQSIWRDQGGSYQFGEPLPGRSRDINQTLQDVFFRMVESRYHKTKTEHRSDDDLWQSVYRAPLRQTRAAEALQPHTITTDAIKLTCNHTFKNGRIHIVQPLTLDYVREDAIGGKAAKWLGNATALKDNDEIGTIYLLLGRPQNDQYLAAYERAKHLLGKMPLDFQMVEEEEAETFARDLATFMMEHSLIPGLG